MKYVSKRDFGQGILIFGIYIFSSILALKQEGFDWILISILSLLFLYLLSIWFGTYYIIKENYLYVHCSISKRKIDILRIVEVKEIFSLISAPACSFDRISLKGNKLRVIISPKEKEAFIAHLLKINSHITFSER